MFKVGISARYVRTSVAPEITVADNEAAPSETPMPVNESAIANADNTIFPAPAPPKDQLSTGIRSKCLRLAKGISDRLEPKRRDHKYTDRVLNNLRNYTTRDQGLFQKNMLVGGKIREAVDQGEIFKFISDSDLQLIVNSGEAFCLDHPETTFNGGRIIQSRYMPLGLAVVAAILTDATRSPHDLVFVAYERWREFIVVMLVKFAHKYRDDVEMKIIAAVEACMGLIINDMLIPMIERYQRYEHKRLRRILYRHMYVRWSFNWEIINLMRIIILRMATDTTFRSLW